MTGKGKHKTMLEHVVIKLPCVSWYHNIHVDVPKYQYINIHNADYIFIILDQPSACSNVKAPGNIDKSNIIFWKKIPTCLRAKTVGTSNITTWYSESLYSML